MKVAKWIWADLNYVEDSAGGPDVTVGILPKLDKVTLLQVNFHFLLFSPYFSGNQQSTIIQLTGIYFYSLLVLGYGLYKLLVYC